MCGTAILPVKVSVGRGEGIGLYSTGRMSYIRPPFDGEKIV